MKTRTIEIYSYSELSDKAKENARQWYREAWAHDLFFSECVFEDAETIAGFLGIEIAADTRTTKSGHVIREPKIYFSGFSSQGDGACFTGDWRADKVNLAGLAGYAPQDQTLARIGAEFARLAALDPDGAFSVKHSGHYSHAYYTEFEFGYENKFTDEDQKDLIQAARDFMNWIYRALESAHDSENSDEVVAETIEANEYEFLVTGART